MHRNAVYLQQLNVHDLKVKEKTEEPLLEIADIIASSLYKTCNHYTSLKITESRYLDELSNIFWCNKEGIILEHGLKPVRGLYNLDLQEKDLMFLRNLKNSRVLD